MSCLISREQAISKSFYIQTNEWWGDVVSVENLMELPEVNLIEELEKIKEEIIENQYITCGLTCIPYGDCKYFDCIEVKEVIECLELIEKHISELKGEQENERYKYLV